jgi:hypothetical protein
MFCGPGGRSTVNEALKGRVRKSRQDVGEVIAYWDVETATALDHRYDNGYSRSGLLTPDMDPVASADRADSGFYCREAIEAYEKKYWGYIVVARKMARLIEQLQMAEWKPSPRTDADQQCEFFY